MSAIERYVQGTIYTRGCNLNCSYCYLKLQEKVQRGTHPGFSLSDIRKAMSKERWGVCYIALAGDGETLIDRSTVDLCHVLSENGHYLNVINNGTMTEHLRYMNEIFTPEQKERTMLTFSLHYLELKRRSLLDTYFSNFRSMREAGFTVYPHMVLADDYLPVIDEIKQHCIEELGILPQIGIVRDERKNQGERIYSSFSREDYFRIADSFESPYFELQKKLYEENCAREYCYAGELGVLLNFTTGKMRQCVCNPETVQVFQNPSAPVPFHRVGNSCMSPWCFCSSLQIFGMVPGKPYPTYSDMYTGERRKYASGRMLDALSTKLADEYVKMHGNEAL